jgi:hypothetical protein
VRQTTTAQVETKPTGPVLSQGAHLDQLADGKLPDKLRGLGHMRGVAGRAASPTTLVQRPTLN